MIIPFARLFNSCLDIDNRFKVASTNSRFSLLDLNFYNKPWAKITQLHKHNIWLVSLTQRQNIIDYYEILYQMIWFYWWKICVKYVTRIKKKSINLISRYAIIVGWTKLVLIFLIEIAKKVGQKKEGIVTLLGIAFANK